MAQPTNQTPVIPFTDNTASNTEKTNPRNSPSKKWFGKPPKWSFTILKFLLVILMPLLSDTPDIQLNFYMINIMF